MKLPSDIVAYLKQGDEHVQRVRSFIAGAYANVTVLHMTPWQRLTVGGMNLEEFLADIKENGIEISTDLTQQALLASKRHLLSRTEDVTLVRFRAWELFYDKWVKPEVAMEKCLQIGLGLLPIEAVVQLPLLIAERGDNYFPLHIPIEGHIQLKCRSLGLTAHTSHIKRKLKGSVEQLRMLEVMGEIVGCIHPDDIIVARLTNK